jgi:uncharacterized protein (TIGR00645 family)
MFLKRLELIIEAILFGGRWLMVPIYLGLVIVLGAISVKFIEELVMEFPRILHMEERDWVIFVLSLVDLALLANLVVMIIFVGYENFVSKLHTGDNEDRPTWMAHVDFSGLKIKLIGSIVAISAIHLLQTFMSISNYSKQDVAWQLAIHLGFVVSGVLLAAMDRLEASSKSKA